MLDLREQIEKAAREYLSNLSVWAVQRFGERPEREQQSAWMVKTSLTSSASEYFSRKVFDRESVQLEIIMNPPQQVNDNRLLSEVLVSAGVQAEEVEHGYLQPLVHRWLEKATTLLSKDDAIPILIDELIEAVFEKRTRTVSVDALEFPGDDFAPLDLDHEVSIRLISSEELWDLGEGAAHFGTHYSPYELLNLASKELKILRIETSHPTSLNHSPIAPIRLAVIAGLRFIGSGRFRILSLGEQRAFGIGSTGRQIWSGRSAHHYGRLAAEAYFLSDHERTRLLDSWSEIRRIMTSEDHFLRFPGQRLLDASTRERHDDSVIDCAIGLESLLTEGVREELSYRFSLRGATTNTWDSTGREAAFSQFKDFYSIRSNLIHGKRPDENRLRLASAFGESALRSTWWWYFGRRDQLLRSITSMIDQRILAN